jgi:hypothetical protein
MGGFLEDGCFSGNCCERFLFVENEALLAHLLCRFGSAHSTNNFYLALPTFYNKHDTREYTT